MAGSRVRRLGLALAIVAGCEPTSEQAAHVEAEATAQEPAAADPHRAALRRLDEWEDRQRQATDFSARAPWSERAGADPFALLRVADDTWLGLLRGAGQVVVLDSEGNERARQATAVDATGWARDGTTVYVVSPRTGSVDRLSWSDAPGVGLVSGEPLSIATAVSLRSIAVGSAGQLAVGDAYEHRVVFVDRPRPEATVAVSTWAADCAGPGALRLTERHLVALCMLDHAVAIWSLDDEGRPRGEPQRIVHDGPIWSLDVHEGPSMLRLALGGVEDHPLDRSDGAFGYVDSFVFLVDVPAAGEPQRRSAVNVGEHGVVTPKWIDLRVDESGTQVRTAGYGGDALATLRWDRQLESATVTAQTLVPGTTDAWISDDGRHGLAADPLLDAWVAWDEDAMQVQSLPDDRPTPLRVGEALAFTGLIAPAATSAGKRSRFTCETCHFEGGADGRVHFTGRANVHATTRSLRGLFENRPHFSRALDRSMATMVNNEFRVGSKGTEGQPWFSVDPADTSWLTHLGVTEPLDGESLRRALMTFVMAYTHEPNPRVLADARGVSDADSLRLRRGVEVFAEHCERCHQARRVTDDPKSVVARSGWLDDLAAGGTIVWASEERMRTGIEPYVHAEGARVPSLRRLFTKRPYFTNGSAASLAQVLHMFSPSDGEHIRDAATEPLSEDDRGALLEFLRRL